MSDWVHRTMLVPVTWRVLAQQLCAGLAGASGTGMFSVDIGLTPDGPVTYGMSTGLIAPTFAALMPLDAWDADAQTYVRTDAGQAEQIVEGAAAVGVALPLATVQALLAAVRVANDPWEVALQRQGLAMVQPEGNE